MEKELFPYLSAKSERRLTDSGVPWVADYDDAVFHRYDDSSNLLVRALLRGKVAKVCQAATAVTAGNPYLAQYAERAGARAIRNIPTVVDLERYSPTPPPDDPFSVGWIGSRTTRPALDLVLDPLSKALGPEDRLLIIGATPPSISRPRVESRAWSATTEVSDLQQCHVGIMPLPDTPWHRGKCGLKLIQYMAAGRPVVASPVGVNVELVEHGHNGFLANTPGEWRKAIETLRADPGLREEMGKRGREKVERQYSLNVTAPRLVALFNEILQAEA